MGDGADDARESEELAAMQEGERAQAPESEVRPEEFTQGTAAPIWASPLPADVVEALRAPLDPNRIRRRDGRGSAKYEYLAGHDVKRRCNELFGFGNWGYRIVELVETGAVEVVSSSNKEGWHVAYRATVELTVRDCLPMSDVGYGDGVEYVPSARVSATELASKEAVTDALKRAATGWGDQFGLILYAKDDERKRIESTAAAADTAGVVSRRDNEGNVPRSLAEIADRMAAVCGDADAASHWLSEAIFAKYGKLRRDLSPGDKQAAGQRCAGLVLDLETAAANPPAEHGGGDGTFAFWTQGVRSTIRLAIESRFDGAVAEGPPWRLDPSETDRQPKPAPEPKAAEAEV